MTMNAHAPGPVSLLWALRSPCNLGCRYCYFGTIEDHRPAPPTQPGILSHLSREDLSLADITAFVDTLPGTRVRRVFLAGGEPLIWPPIMDVIAGIKAAEVQVVVCTNGLPLNRPDLVAQLLARDVDAVSVSVDSTDPVFNDRYRPARNGRHGHADVLTGIRSLLAARGAAARPRVGIYAAIGRGNIDAIGAVARLATDLGCDYMVPQPMSLAVDHPLHTQLSLTREHIPALTAAFDALDAADLPLHLPHPSYRAQFIAVTRSTAPGPVRGCFGGTNLFFIEPDGSVWDCPSALKIAKTRPERRRTIRATSATALFPPTGSCADCQLFSRDCVSMWPLMDFDAILTPKAAAT
jgi:MoaA/NifB/PqqE/SkfB family radical SAM enzyme